MAPDAKTYLNPLFDPTHEMSELPTPTHSRIPDPNREMRVTGVTRSASKQASWYAQFNTIRHKRHGYNRSELNMINACMQHIKCLTQKQIQQCKAYTAASIITHAQSKAVKQAHIRTSILLIYNYNKAVPSNTDLTPAKPNTDTSSGTLAQKITNWELRAQPNLSYPSNTIEGSKQSTRLEKGDVFAHLSSFTQASKSSTKQSVLARGVQRYHSYFGQSYLPSAIREDKVR
ncbi:hypothetical protein F511_24615 [Dorcoceras hygrometricum]|uniref:Uncharacterized protein n=1 Tax=Dorcoceras hygrometricum TaxID=472368 RepID=A0A2Z7AN88_9LAMI|nr:hypothetical protein F511_24615 [Dorcoceras hygrometricum]